MKLVINLNKRVIFTLGFLLVTFASIFVVYAFADANGVGHDPSQIGVGVFGDGSGVFYTFLNPVHMQTVLLLGKTGQANQGIIRINPGLYGGDAQVLNIDNAGGSFRISNSAWSEIFSIDNDGDINVKNGAGINLGGVKKTAWDTQTFLTGMHCGLLSFETKDGLIQTSGINNPIRNMNRPCLGKYIFNDQTTLPTGLIDPAVMRALDDADCPSGFSLAGGDYEDCSSSDDSCQAPDRYWFSCIKN